MEGFFLGHGGCESDCVGDALPDIILTELRKCENPSDELQAAIGDVKSLLAGLEMLAYQFGMLCSQTRAEQPDDDAPNEVYRDWEDKPRYVVPVHEPGEAIKRTAKSMVDEARAAA